MSLKKKAVGGMIWTLTQQFSVQIINFLVLILLGRLLEPKDFGLIAMLQIFIAIGKSLMDSGMTSSVIRTIEADQRDYSTVFWMNLMLSIFLYIVLFFSAPFIANYYGQPMLTDLVRVFTLSFVLQALANMHTTKLTKEMNFKLQMVMQIPSVLLASAVGILMAYQGYGVWSLVWMNLMQVGLYMVQLWLFTKWRPSFVLNRNRFLEHFKFGYKITLPGLLYTLYRNVYIIVIAKHFSPSLVGFYSQAENLRSFPTQQLSRALDKVTYPLFSAIQEDEVKLKLAYKKIMLQVFFILVPIMVALIVFAEPVFILILTEKWLPSVPFFQILCIAGLMQPLQTYNLNVLKVKGRPDLYLKLNLITKVMAITGVFLVVPLGIYGLVWFQTLFAFIMFYINSFYTGKFINYNIKEQIKDFSPIFAVGLISGSISWFVYWHFLVLEINGLILKLVLGLSFFCLLYFFLCYIFRISALNEVKSIIAELSSLRKINNT